MKNSNQSVKAQRARLLEALRKQPVTTIYARHALDILGVAPRIHELRHKHGHNIVTRFTEVKNPGGGKHRVAEYALLSGFYEGETA